MKELAGKRVVVTGASSGIGAELARALAKRKAVLLLAARRADRLHRVVDDCLSRGARAAGMVVDLATEDGCRSLIERATTQMGGIDVLLLNAGISHRKPLVDETDAGVFERVMRTNWLGPVHCAWRALPQLVKAKGAIVVVSSVQGKAGFPGFAAYSASKHALHGFFDSLRIELLGSGVGVTIVCPGAVATDIADGRPPERNQRITSAAACADEILDALMKGERERVLSWKGKVAVGLRPLAPGLLDRAIARRARRFFPGSS